jgi:hypothetical protein
VRINEKERGLFPAFADFWMDFDPATRFIVPAVRPSAQAWTDAGSTRRPFFNRSVVSPPPHQPG